MFSHPENLSRARESALFEKMFGLQKTGHKKVKFIDFLYFFLYLNY